MNTVGETHPIERIERPSAPPRRPLAGVKHGEFDILECGVPRKKVKRLKDEAYLAIPQLGQSLFIKVLNRLSIEEISPGRRPVERAHNVQ